MPFVGKVVVRWLCGVVGLVCVVMWGCKWQSESAGERQPELSLQEEKDTLVAYAVAVTRAAQEHLSGTLVRELRHRGQIGAIGVCNEKAEALLEEVRQRFPRVVELRRISHRPRNPANRAEGEELDIVRGFIAQLREGRQPEPEVVKGEHSVYVYVPIVLSNPLCLSCHGVVGRDIPDTVYSVIREFYPQDSAVGFRIGELRGAWRVVLKGES